jgi:bifunctional non-homologous end joining protein LigD
LNPDGPLKHYHSKRDFRQTPEPRGRVAKSGGKRFVIQKHAATRLHFDFRLEFEGVLKSWAITRGPSLNPADKRLAVRTEDHPIEYAGFEGVIPRGYGAGTVMLWDSGEWEPREDPAVGLKKGALKFTLKGGRLQGAFALVRMKTQNEKRENWLLIKQQDQFSTDEIDPVEQWTTSIRSDRSLAQIASKGEDYQAGKRYPVDPPASERTRSRRDGGAAGQQRRLQFVPPQLATLRPHPPEGKDWAHEVKYDGYRLQALLEPHRVRLLTRNQKDWTHRYPGIADAVRQLDVQRAILDGELVALDQQGRSNYSALQKVEDDSSLALSYYVYDLLHLNGKSLTGLSLLERKAQLQDLLKKSGGVIQYSDHILGDGAKVVEKACAMRLEGIVSKRTASHYRSGRGTSWIKSKCSGRDEFVIAGYRESDKPGRAFASLILAEYADGELRYRGRVGTGFDTATLQQLAAQMAPLARKTSPLHSPPAEACRDAVWLRPKLVAQIAYTELTAEGRLRHPSFLGLREDKPAGQVTSANAAADSAVTISGVRLTHPGRVMYAQQGATKLAIAQYYQRHAAEILLHLKGRPVSLVRCPSGAEGECFFQKHHNASVPEALEKISIREKQGKREPYLLINSTAGLVAAAQIGALELHIWGARSDRLEYPERLVFDLDPDASLPFSAVRNAAVELRDLLAAIDLRSFPLLTGGKGIHVIVPLVRRRGWDDVKAFSRGLARKLEQAAPDRYVASASKARRHGRIFIDWLRNERGATAVAPYSPRALHTAPMASPDSCA